MGFGRLGSGLVHEYCQQLFIVGCMLSRCMNLLLTGLLPSHVSSQFAFFSSHRVVTSAVHARRERTRTATHRRWRKRSVWAAVNDTVWLLPPRRAKTYVTALTKRCERKASPRQVVYILCRLWDHCLTDTSERWLLIMECIHVLSSQWTSLIGHTERVDSVYTVLGVVSSMQFPLPPQMHFLPDFLAPYMGSFRMD